MVSGLIAEIGNHHFGDLKKAKELITAAKNAGASYVKLQAIDTKEFKGGSMPPEFYQQCDLGLDGYEECAAHGADIKIPVFFSVFGKRYQALRCRWKNRPYKISGGQFESFSKTELAKWNSQDRNPVVISIPRVSDDALLERRPVISNMHAMYVTPYLAPRVEFRLIEHYMELLGKPVGYSDHTPGVAACGIAIKKYGCTLVEKHFNLYGVQNFGGRVYRDSMHAANAEQLERLAKLLS